MIYLGQNFWIIGSGKISDPQQLGVWGWPLEGAGATSAGGR
jgi:hypothetical protein